MKKKSFKLLLFLGNTEFQILLNEDDKFEGKKVKKSKIFKSKIYKSFREKWCIKNNRERI